MLISLLEEEPINIWILGIWDSFTWLIIFQMGGFFVSIKFLWITEVCLLGFWPLLHVKSNFIDSCSFVVLELTPFLFSPLYMDIVFLSNCQDWYILLVAFQIHLACSVRFFLRVILFNAWESFLFTDVDCWLWHLDM